MSIGQVAEIATMAWLGFFLKRLGWRTTMILGILGHVVRFGIYSIGRQELLWLVILSNVVHGFAYAFFFATVYIYVDENFPKDVRTSAQSLFNLLILGLGPLVGNFIWGWLGDFFSTSEPISPGRDTVETIIDYHKLFLVPMAVGLAGHGDPGDLLPPPGQGPRTRGGPGPGKLMRGTIGLGLA